MTFKAADQSEDFIGLYFGQYSNPGSLKFTQQLIGQYWELNCVNKSIEVFYVSFDRDFGEYKKHVEHMPWILLPWQTPFGRKLKMKFNATEVPKFVILRKNMSLLTQEGKEILLRGGAHAI